ncbi:MAG TPA: PDZ domain-containing protein [Candidatus Acidoferrales bacterium]|nr:PDZ domain-containing protein [Candidatus Acidoferrales bacterium]
MGKNGGKPPEMLTLEEALRRFASARKQTSGDDLGVETLERSNVRYADFAPATDKVGERATGEPANADAPSRPTSADDIVAMIDGVPRTLAQLESLAVAEQAYGEDFPEAPTAESDSDEITGAEIAAAAFAAQQTTRRDFAFSAMGTAFLVFVAVLLTRVPIVQTPKTFAHRAAMIALKASSFATAEDLIATWVIIPDSDVSLDRGRSLKPGELEARIKNTLKVKAFPDIGVSVAKNHDAYLAGEVFSQDEAQSIVKIVHRVSGVNRVHFLHPDIRVAQGPAYFGVTAAWAPDVWGAKVQAVFIGSPADKAGIQPGDVISEFDGNTIPNAKAFDELLATYAPGQRVQFRVWHNGEPVYLIARLGEMTTVASR